MRTPSSPPAWTRVIVVLVLIFLYVPFLWMLIRAFDGPSGWGFGWFAAVFDNRAWMEALGRSLLVAFAASAAATVLGLGAAVATPSRLGRWLSAFSVASLVLPELVFALSLLSWFVTLKLELGLATVILSHTTFSLSIAYFLILGRFRQIDPALLEAAADLGAGSLQVFVRVLLPLLAPSLGVSFALGFLLSFDDFLISFFVSGPASDTLPIKLYSSMKMGLTPSLHALAALMSGVSAAALFLILRSPQVRQVFGAVSK